MRRASFDENPINKTPVKGWRTPKGERRKLPSIDLIEKNLFQKQTVSFKTF